MNKSVPFGLKEFLDFIPDMVCVVDEYGVIIDCNNTQAEKLGYTKDELLGKLGFDLIAQEDRPYAIAEFEKLKHQDRVENIELWALTKNGRYRALTTTSKIPYSDDSTKFLIVTKDITQSYIQQKKLKQVKENFSTLGELTSKIAHDIRNPLTVMRNQISIIDKNITDDDIKNRLANMDHLISDINSMVTDIVNYTKIEAGDKKIIHSDELIHFVLRGITIPKTVNFEHTGSVSVLCDQTKLSIVLRNLISNSIDAIQENGKISVNFSEDNDNTIIQVTDSGQGVPDGMSDKIFDLLYTTKENGTGLGLSICKNIILSHGGTISFSNNPTTFTVKLPRK